MALFNELKNSRCRVKLAIFEYIVRHNNLYSPGTTTVLCNGSYLLFIVTTACLWSDYWSTWRHDFELAERTCFCVTVSWW